MKNYCNILVLFFLLFSGNIFRLHAQNDLSVVFRDGSNEQFSINSINNIKFEKNGINIYMGTGSTTVYSISTIRKLIFKNASRINELTDNMLQIQLYPNPVNDQLFIRNINIPETYVKIYTLDGVEVRNEPISSMTNSINVSQLPKGFYLLKINNQTLKFSKI